MRTWCILTVLVVIIINSSACSKTSNQLVESPPAYQPTPVALDVKLPKVVPAKLTEVRDAVQRVFKDCAVIDSSSDPTFVTGDFNGDASQDLAVILKPAPGKLAEINEEYPAWLLRDPLTAEGEKRSTLNVDEHELLLAIIHGYGDNDWRDSQATQTFLLKNVAGSNLAVKSQKDFQSAHAGRRLPRPQGDLIKETLKGTDGYLYYSSANYSWYDPRTFKPKATAGMIHGGR